MGWDEKLFGWLYSKATARKTQVYPGAMALASCLTRLEVFAAAVTGYPVIIRASSDLEIPNTNYIPLPPLLAVFDTPEDNLWLYRHRILQHIVMVEYAQPVQGDPLQVWQASLAHQSTTFQLVSERWDKLCLPDRLPQTLEKLAVLPGQWWRDPASPGHLVAMQPNQAWMKADASGGLQPGTGSDSNTHTIEVAVATAGKASLVELDEEDQNPLMHTFEKTMTADEYSGGSRRQEGATEEEATSEAIQDLVFRNVIRSDVQTDVLFKSDAILDVEVQDEDDCPCSSAAYTYPEWFCKDGRYKEDWCAVQEHTYQLRNGAVPYALTARERQIRERFEQMMNSELVLKRQKQGHEIDIDAAIRGYTQLQASGIPEERVYLARRKLEKDIAVLVLLDSSQSTDSWVVNTRVMDIIQHALAVMGHTLADSEDRFGVAAFHSFARQDCRFDWIKQFDDPWQPGMAFHPCLKPQGHTRIGPILRHAHQALKLVPARRRAIFLVSDARPSDLDRYEGRHGNEDVRKAIQELSESQIGTHVFVIEKQYHHRLETMFGSAHCHLYRSREDLPPLLNDTFMQLMQL